MKTVMSCAALVLAATFAQAQVDPAEMQVGAVFTADLVDTQAGVCAAREPGARPAWDGALQAWKERHRTELADLRRLAAQLEAKDPALAVAARAQAVAMPLHMLAAANDREAARLCDGFLKNLSNPKAHGPMFTAAKAAAAAALARLDKPR